MASELDQDNERAWNKLSKTAKEALILLDKATIWDDGQIVKYWVPNERCEFATGIDGSIIEIYVFGGSFVSALKGLANKGLARSMKLHNSYAITEYGRVVIEAARSAVATAEGRERVE